MKIKLLLTFCIIVTYIISSININHKTIYVINNKYKKIENVYNNYYKKKNIKKQLIC